MESLVSVIVPVYNVEKYLQKCVQSIQKQSYQNIEIILVNDGSKDNSLSICNELAKNDERIIVLDKQNGGLSDARNFGIHHAQGEWYSFIDSDDFIHEEMIDSMLKYAVANSADIAVCDMEYLYDDGKLVLASGGKFECDSVLDNPSLIRINNSACNKIFHRSLFDDIEFPVGKYYEDLATIPILLYKAKKIVKVNKSYYTYFQRSGSIAHTANKKIFDIYDAINTVIDYVVNRGNEKKIIDELYHLYIIHGLDLTTIRIKDFDDKAIRENYLMENMMILKNIYPDYEQDLVYRDYNFKKKLIFRLMKMGRMKMVLRIYDL